MRVYPIMYIRDKDIKTTVSFSRSRHRHNYSFSSTTALTMTIVPTSASFCYSLILPFTILLGLMMQVESWNLSPSSGSLRLSCRNSSPSLLCSRRTTSPMLLIRHQSCFTDATRHLLAVSSSSSPDETTQDLLEKARKLREQAKSLEDKLDRKSTSPSSSSSVSPGSSQATRINPPSEVEDSIWTISYRFSSQPEAEDDNRNDESSSFTPVQQQQTRQLRRTFYSGKVTLKFKNDGYTEVIAAENENYSSKDVLQIVKAWGWDKEISNEDNKEYLLWSMDVRFPTTDPDLPDQQERLYFQARVDDENQGRTSQSPSSSSSILSLKDGTVTVKKDVAEKTSGWWGVFRVGGILTRFRYTGDFVARPSSSSSSSSSSSAAAA